MAGVVMTAHHCRIGRVIVKNSGADLTIFPGGSGGQKDKIWSRIRDMAEKFTEDEDEGWLFITWDKVAAYRIDYHLGDMNVITPGLLPAWIHDIILREVIHTNGLGVEYE